MVIRMNKMITKEKMLWSFIKFSPLILKGMYEDQSGEFVWGTEQRAGRVIGVLTIERKIPNLSDGIIVESFFSEIPTGK